MPNSIHHSEFRIQNSLFLLLIALLLLSPSLARSDDLLSRTIPGKWIEPLVPESDPEPAYPEYYAKDLLAKASMQINAGQYRRALSTLGQVPPTKSPNDVSVLKVKAMIALGRFDAALELLSKPELATFLPAEILHADLLGQLERYPESLDLLKKLADANPTSVPVHFYLGWYLEKSGDYDNALKAYSWFTDPARNYVAQWRGHAKEFTDAQDVVCIGRALDRWATLSGTYMQDQSLNNLILSMFTASYQRIDSEYFAAHDAAAEYFVSHDDPDKALPELSAALTGNPHDAIAHAIAGRIAVDGFNFAATEQQIAAIRDVDADSITADLLEARNLLQQRRPKEALTPLNAVLSRRPNNIEAMGLLGGAQALLLHDDITAQLLAKADTIAPKSPVAYFEVAEQLATMRQYPRSAAMYKTAVDRAGWWSAARNGYGLLETQTGDEATARVVLEAAHAVDPFNVRAVNYLKLLDMMEKFKSKESDHFIVTYDPIQDPIVPEYFSDYLESIYKDVTGDFKYEPPQKTLIEVFPTHDAFSVRTTGAPWIATVGASTGRVICLAAPRDGAGGAFNWSRVVRHEFTHTVTLGVTDNRIAHWFTEGLAVWEEHAGLQWEWVPMLQDAVKTKKLFKLENLTWAFVRPQQPNDRQLAYAESYWIVTYIEEKYGHAAILALCDQMRLGHDLNEAFTAAIHEDADKFYDEFFAWCTKQVAGWGYDDPTDAKYKDLVAAADDLIHDQNYTDAAKKWEEIVAIRPMDLLPHERLMGLYLQVKDWNKAIGQLEIIETVELKDNRYTKVLARLYDRAGKLDQACQVALKAVYINPYDMSAHELLAELDKKAGNNAGADRETRVMPILQKWLDNKSTQEADSPNTARPAPTGQ
jgi:tetratricopeptide (TPR) repeat protein